jgi:protein-disulfide isomerase
MSCLVNPVAQAEDKWVADEIFLQISEMRKEIQQLQQKVAGLEQKLAEQQPKLTAIDLTGTDNSSIGKQDATIAILEFSDYECPYCGKHYKNVLPKLRESYIDTGKVKYVMKDFPLEFHAHAKKASLAARCAGEQKQYWPMHNAIFEANGQASEQLVNDTVKQLKLNDKKFKSCLEDPKQLTAIEKDIALGASLGVTGTPAFVVGTVKDHNLINYKRFDGVQSFETFVGVISGLKKP